VIAAVQGNGSINLPTIDLPQFENFTQVLTDFLNGNKTNGFNQIESLSIMTQQLDQLQQINRNTSYNRELTRIRQILDEIKNDPSNNIRANGGY